MFLQSNVLKLFITWKTKIFPKGLGNFVDIYATQCKEGLLLLLIYGINLVSGFSYSVCVRAHPENKSSVKNNPFSTRISIFWEHHKLNDENNNSWIL